MSTILAGNNLNQNPIGMILIWNKTTLIPSGWKECNGLFGTPNLRDKFLKCVPNNVTNPGTLGGLATVTILLATLGVHTHGMLTNSHSHTWESTRADSAGGGARYQGAGDLPFFADKITEEVQVVSAIQAQGGDGAHNNLPQFNDSFYIMRIK